MDNFSAGEAPQELAALSYDDTVSYEEQLPTEAERTAAASLANRIGTSKVYLLSETSAVPNRAVGKRKTEEGGDDDEMNEDEEMDEDLSYRANALLLNGSPIANLPTTRIFAYATHFDAHPLGLEWVDDNTCVLVFESRKAAREAFSRLQKTTLEQPNMDEFLTARPFPVALWPPEERINQTLGQGQGLKGVIHMRWAKPDDIKKKDAMRNSKFYKKHGSSAGKELFNGRDLPPAKRRRHDLEGTYDDEVMKAQLDNELDEFLAEDDENDDERHKNKKFIEGEDIPGHDTESDIPASPPSKMRSDYIAKDGRTLLQRTSDLRAHNPWDARHDLASRLTAPLPRRSRQRRGGRTGDLSLDGSTNIESLGDRLQPRSTGKLEWGTDHIEQHRNGNGRARAGELEANRGEDRNRRRRRRGGGEEDDVNGQNNRRQKTQQELDDELDAFLRGS